MRIIRTHETGGCLPVGAEELAHINKLSKKPLAAEEVYTFSVRLCDNEVDREGERFSLAALEGLAPLFVGKSGLFDHHWSAKGQAARIYRTEVCAENGTQTAAGDPYYFLKGYAYMLRTEGNRDLIAEIDGGIKREVSVGCAVNRAVCSICGAERGTTCPHQPGKVYGGALCYIQLEEPTDAYEWSFVAVPAQRRAGVMKGLGRGREGVDPVESETLRAEAELGRRYLAGLRAEVVRLGGLADPEGDGAIRAKLVGRLDEGELLELRRDYETRLEMRFPITPQLRYCRKEALEPSKNREFVI